METKVVTDKAVKEKESGISEFGETHFVYSKTVFSQNQLSPCSIFFFPPEKSKIRNEKSQHIRSPGLC
jgi:hypothetical protein